MTRRDKPTINDVAARAGVSKSLVSRVLTGNGSASEHARAKILKAVDELGYTANTQARGLKSGRSGVVGVLLRSAVSAFYGELFRDLQAIAETEGYRVVAATGNLNEGSEARALEALVGLRVDGLIIGSGTLPNSVIRSVADRTPTVVVGRGAGRARADVIRIDSHAAATHIIERLLQHNHHEALVLTFPGSLSAKDRLADLRRAANAHKFHLHELPAHYDYAPAREAVSKYLERTTPPSAVIALASGTAQAVCDALTEHGYAVPAERSVMTLDVGTEDPRLRWMLSGCRIDVQTLATTAWKQISERMDDVDADRPQLHLAPAVFVDGATVAPAVQAN